MFVKSHLMQMRQRLSAVGKGLKKKNQIKKISRSSTSFGIGLLFLYIPPTNLSISDHRRFGYVMERDGKEAVRFAQDLPFVLGNDIFHVIV